MLKIIAAIAASVALLTPGTCKPDTTAGGKSESGTLNATSEDSGSGVDTGSGVDSGSGVDTDRDHDAEGSATAATRMVQFDDCDALLDHLRDEYAQRAGPWGFDHRGGIPRRLAINDGPEEIAWTHGVNDMAVPLAEPVAVEEASTGESQPVEGTDYSGTNVQETGVDEPDIVKTDGRRIFTVARGRLVVVDAASKQETGSVAVIDGNDPELLIHGDSVLLVTNTVSHFGTGLLVAVQRISVAGGVPQIVETLLAEGEYVSARSVGGIARLILRYDPRPNFPFVRSWTRESEPVAEQANRAAVLDSTLDDWLPRYSVGGGDPSNGSLLADCTNVHVPSEYAGFGITTVASLPFDDEFDPAATATVIAPGDTVYASAESVYVATTRRIPSWRPADTFIWPGPPQDQVTSIHRFGVAAGGSARYAASGEVAGIIHNQFSLSEHAGHLRVVTTENVSWGPNPESFVRVLRQKGDRLMEVGSVGDIGRGERVQSVRFVGDIGFVVTFRQIDPFYTIDLSDPTDPVILGELKIPGFSSYLHPIGDDFVLGVGSEADFSGRVTGAKVSLFDVSDLTAPSEVAVWSAPKGWSDVGWDHRAFLWWAPEKLAVVPVSVRNGWSGAVVLRVAEGTIDEVGYIEHALAVERRPPDECWHWPIRELPLEFSGDTSVEFRHPVSGCPPAYQPREIVRAMVIGDEIWTLGRWHGRYVNYESPRLQVNDLRSLEHLAALDL